VVVVVVVLVVGYDNASDMCISGFVEKQFDHYRINDRPSKK
jgi:hypothetical protein